MKISTSSNKTLVSSIRSKLKENGGYCPCRVQQNEDTKCMCKEFREKIEKREPGECHCGLYTITLDSDD
ncbi:MAG: ferredoxin thioredoxin reductase catalytic beta chain [Clostridia bacterium]|nr:ferredoxin thioredoxin reductase catalytic beta chain [Clostridia bacterium]